MNLYPLFDYDKETYFIISRKTFPEISDEQLEDNWATYRSLDYFKEI